MKVVIDSTVICQDFMMSGVQFTTLRAGYGLVPIALNVPEVVVDEVVNKYREMLSTTKSQASKILKELSRLFAPDDPRILNLDLIDVESEARKYKEYLLAHLNLFGAEILPYTTLSHNAVVERDLSRKKPFKQNGSGYRDYLIWQNIKGLMISGHERVVFVTSNSTDFGVNNVLAQELREDLFNPENLELLPNIKSLNDKYVLPHLALLKESKSKILASIDSPFDLESWLKSELLELIRYEDMDSIVTGFPDGVGGVYASELVAIKSFHVEEIRKLSEESRIVLLKVVADIDFSVSDSWGEYWDWDEVRHFFGGTDERFTYTSVNTIQQIELAIQIILDNTHDKPVEVEIAYVSGPYGNIE